MRVHVLVMAIGMLCAAPAVADVPNTNAVQNATETFLKLYPPRALAAHEEGTVGFSVTVDRAGGVTECHVTQSSGHPLLDQETCNLITLHAQFPAQQGLSGSETRTQLGVVNWRLPGSNAQLASAKPVETSPLDKVVCKRTARIGTLAGFERTCMTMRDWNRQSDEQKQVWEDSQGKKGFTSGH